MECSVIFVFLLLLFYLNTKGSYIYTYNQLYNYFVVSVIFIYFVLVDNYLESDNYCFIGIGLYSLVDNYYESLFNTITNDLFGFSISYYLINGIEFLFIGFLLLIASVICVNLYQTNKNIRTQPYSNYLSVFNFFHDFCNFNFLRKQNLIKQGNNKASLKVFQKK